jgi:hypothetical protein
MSTQTYTPVEIPEIADLVDKYGIDTVICQLKCLCDDRANDTCHQWGDFHAGSMWARIAGQLDQIEY